jgi:ribosomal protein S6--L-glutamate ligase
MKFGILTTRTERYHPNRRMTEAAREMGHEAILIHPLRCSIQVGRLDSPILYGGGSFPVIDVLLPRIGATIDDYELTVVRHLESMGIPLVNGYRSLLLSRDKFLTLQTLDALGIQVPKSALVVQEGNIQHLISKMGGYPVVLKVRRGRQGKGVMLAENSQAFEFALHHQKNGSGLLVQEFVKEAGGRDIRILIIGGRVIATMMRVSKKGEFRANVHLKARGRPYEPPNEMTVIAKTAAKAIGLDVAGVDMVISNEGPSVIEVNSTPGFRELERVCRKDLARTILSHAETLAKGRVKP